jgi:two-component system sensor histidine kinase DesK
MSVVRSIKTSWELQAAREEIAHLAVTTKRLRIARDLHDLLGHNLSLIALKSELARRLVHVAPERAVVEISDVEQVACTTLQEVREAVASYRQPTLLNELHAAQEILAAAGITYHFEDDEKHNDPLPTAIEAVLAWAVREGVTNVIRHSRAQQCTITLKRERHTACVEIIDDGTGTVDQPKESAHSSGKGGGSGLRGLAERVTALEGQFEAGPCIGKGFQLAVSVPLTKKTGTPGIIPAPPVQQRQMVLSEHVNNADEKRSKKQ